MSKPLLQNLAKHYSELLGVLVQYGTRLEIRQLLMHPTTLAIYHTLLDAEMEPDTLIGTIADTLVCTIAGTTDDTLVNTTDDTLVNTTDETQEDCVVHCVVQGTPVLPRTKSDNLIDGTSISITSTTSISITSITSLTTIDDGINDDWTTQSIDSWSSTPKSTHSPDGPSSPPPSPRGAICTLDRPVTNKTNTLHTDCIVQ